MRRPELADSKAVEVVPSAGGDQSAVSPVGDDSTHVLPPGDVPDAGVHGLAEVGSSAGDNPTPHAPAPKPFQGPALGGQSPSLAAPPNLALYVQLPGPISGSGGHLPSAPPEKDIFSGVLPNSTLAMEGYHSP